MLFGYLKSHSCVFFSVYILQIILVFLILGLFVLKRLGTKKMEQKYLESLEMWCWRRVDKKSN
jgi:hypothetical protein